MRRLGETSPHRHSMLALLAMYPRLRNVLPHVDLRVRETPVERWSVGGATLLAKRDDLSAQALGGNKVRALELLLAGLGPDHRILTVGATGSTHALAVAHYAARLGADCDVITWPQETHDIARATAVRLERLAQITHARSPLDAYARAAVRRMRGGVTWIPAGGSTPVGALGHASAALELVAQLGRDGIPMPDIVVAPLGSGGTIAGLLVGFALAGVATRVVGVRVVPLVIGNRSRVLWLARRTRAHLGRLTGESLAEVDGTRFEIDHGAYGDAYGRETPAAREAARLLLASGGPRLDGTYSAKAFAVALDRAQRAPDQTVLFWLTFDGRWLDAGDAGPSAPRSSRR